MPGLNKEHLVAGDSSHRRRGGVSCGDLMDLMDKEVAQTRQALGPQQPWKDPCLLGYSMDHVCDIAAAQ